MPFTFSHPAIILPFRSVSGKYVSMTGLVIGSITPDFEYFIRMRVQSIYSHTLPGLITYNLPLGILLAFIFHNIVRNKLINNLPTVLQSRFSRFEQFNWNKHFRNKWLVISLSVVIGAASHLLWDSFTHEHGYFVNRIPELQKIIELLGHRLPTLKILQHTSSLIGALIVAYTIYTLPVKSLNSPKTPLLYWLSIAILTLLIFGIRFYGNLDLHEYGNIIVSIISALLFSTIVISLIIPGVKPDS